MSKLYKLLSGIIAISVLVTAFMAYFMRSIDTKKHIIYDGLGRVLSEPPLWAKFILTDENSWAGLGWHIIDIIWFFGGLSFAFWLHSFSERHMDT